MAITTSYITQLRSAKATVTTLSDYSVVDVDYPSNFTDDKMQQWVIKGTFNANTCYHIKVTIKQNANYDLNYGIRLISGINYDSGTNLQEKSYQFVKYITIPKYSITSNEKSEIWHYTDGTQVNAAVALPYSAFDNINDASARAHKIFYNNNVIYLCDKNGEIIQENGSNKNYKTDNFKWKTYTFVNNFDTEKGENITREFLVYPESNYDAIYFYLVPINEDSNMLYDNGNRIGRHVTISQDVTIEVAEVSKVNLPENAIINNIGIWGRSEQLMLLNGQELKIGPSGYYELKNFNVDSLYIVNNDDDKYTIDIQYTTS